SGDLDQERKSVKKIEEMFDEQGKIEGLIVNLIGDSKLVLIHSSVSSMVLCRAVQSLWSRL
ncbi:MAG TPA: hypothetical protein PKG85_10400, partial [Mesotoga infera]|nr:hypothetical protein [Mesotoga infera]